jgi:hypothetical protein
MSQPRFGLIHPRPALSLRSSEGSTAGTSARTLLAHLTPEA